jgi:hypothetical protein
MVLFDGYEPCIVALNIILGGLHLVYAFIPVYGQYGPNYRRVLEEWVKRCGRRSANTLALYSCHSYYYWRCMAFSANRRSQGTLAAPTGRIRRAN